MSPPSNRRTAEVPGWPAREDLRVLNTPLRRLDGPDKVTGRARYTHDVRLPGMVWARLVCCPYGPCEVTIDLAPALALPGVVAARGLLEGGDPLSGRTLYLGQPVAVVAAETSEGAEDGARALAVQFEPLDCALTREAALASFAPEVTKRGNRIENKTEGDRELAERAIAGAATSLSATYGVPVQHHVCLETHGLVVDARGEAATVYASSQAVDFVAQQAARALGVGEAQIEAIVDHMGGGFGGKFQIGAEGLAACALSRELGRPVHLMLTRWQEFVMAGNRSGCVQRLSGGIDAEGRLVGLVAEVERLGGIGLGSYPGQPYIYTVADDAYFLADHSVHTHTDSHRAMRAPGHPQAAFGSESLIDELACAAGLDPLLVRKKNLADPVYQRQLDRAALAIGWDAHAHKIGWDQSAAWTKTGIGFAVSTWGGGGRAGCGAEVRIARDASVEVRIAVQDLGTGVRTLVGAIVAEELGVPLDQVAVRIGRSSYPQGVGSGGSVTTGSVAPVVKEAAYLARTELVERVAAGFGLEAAGARLEGGELRSADGARAASWAEACAALGPDGAVGSSAPRREWGDLEHLTAQGVHGVQAARVRVDTLTGAVHVERMVCVQDCGLPLNRLAIQSQVNGGMIQGLSYGLLEERVLDPDLGLMLNATLGDYKIAGSLEIPDMQVLIDDEDTGRGPIGIGEPPVIPGHAAIANAIFNACGVRLRELPMTPDRVLDGLAALAAGGGK